MIVVIPGISIGLCTMIGGTYEYLPKVGRYLVYDVGEESKKRNEKSVAQ